MQEELSYQMRTVNFPYLVGNKWNPLLPPFGSQKKENWKLFWTSLHPYMALWNKPWSKRKKNSIHLMVWTRGTFSTLSRPVPKLVWHPFHLDSSERSTEKDYELDSSNRFVNQMRLEKNALPIFCKRPVTVNPHNRFLTGTRKSFSIRETRRGFFKTLSRNYQVKNLKEKGICRVRRLSINSRCSNWTFPSWNLT